MFLRRTERKKNGKTHSYWNVVENKPRACGVSSMPRLLGFIICVSGILGRPVKPGDDNRGRGASVFDRFRRHNPAFSRRDSPEVCLDVSRLESESAGNAGCAVDPRSRVQNGKRKRTRAYRFSGGAPTFPAQWLYGLLRALPGESGFFASVAFGYGH